ncbi:hypothetical protein FACS1894204_04070 [Synergistales bacterium]|nr:hypothetical protein FACS1894204_04070 [Synergistales bacterium]
MIKYSKGGTVRLFWLKADSRKYGIQINEQEPPERDPELNARLSGANAFGVTTGEVGSYTFDLADETDIAAVDAIIGTIDSNDGVRFAFVKQTAEGEYEGFYVSDIAPDPEYSTFNMETLSWDTPENVGELKANRAKEEDLTRREAEALRLIETLENKSLRCIRALTLNPDDATEKGYLEGYEARIAEARAELTVVRAEKAS